MSEGLKTGKLHDFLLSNGFSHENILDFIKNLYESGKTSVDAFLEHRTDFLEIGKLAIAYILSGFEDSETLYSSGKGKWYKYLFDKMNTNSFEDFGNNKISIITYNYDRSLDYFLFNSLQNLYDKNQNECSKVIAKIPIIQLHGELGFLPWQNVSARDYKKENVVSEIKIAAKNIKIIHENINSDPEFSEAQQKLRAASRIYILGFGYNEINVQRLGLQELPSDGKVIMGATKGFDGKALENKMRICNHKVKMPNIFNDSLDFLKHYAELD
jgi:hypothetical protein